MLRGLVLFSAVVALVAVAVSFVPPESYPDALAGVACSVSVTYCRTAALFSAVSRGQSSAVTKLLSSGLANPRARNEVSTFIQCEVAGPVHVLTSAVRRIGRMYALRPPHCLCVGVLSSCTLTCVCTFIAPRAVPCSVIFWCAAARATSASARCCRVPGLSGRLDSAA